MIANFAINARKQVFFTVPALSSPIISLTSMIIFDLQGTVTILKNFTSLTLNIELGVCVVLMLRRSHEHKFR